METTVKLKVLNKAGVVDAKGFVLFIEGVIDFIKNRDISNLDINSHEVASIIHSEEIIGEEINNRFCTEAIIKTCL